MDDQALERVVRNEVAFRLVNERLRASAGLADTREAFPVTCECGWLGCNRMLELTVPEYEAVRAHARRFFVVDGHVIDEAEAIVERHAGYLVVEKPAEEGQIAEELDPRAGEHDPAATEGGSRGGEEPPG